MKFTEDEIKSILSTSEFKYALVAYKENEIDAVVYFYTLDELRDSFEVYRELFGDGYTFDIMDSQGKHYTITEGVSS